MNVTEVLRGHQAQLAAFTETLFGAPASQSPATSDDDDTEGHARHSRSSPESNVTPLSLLLLPHYRRPASANIPVSQVKREARRRERRQGIRVDKGTYPGHLIDVVSSAAEMQASHRSRRRVKARRRCLAYVHWRGLLKRRARLRAWRRAGAVRRRRRRQEALRYGRLCQPCACSTGLPARHAASKQEIDAVKETVGQVRCGRSRHVVQWLPSHRYAYSRFHMARQGVRLSHHVTHRVAGAVSRLAVTAATNEERAAMTSKSCRLCLLLPTRAKCGCHRCLQRWATQLMFTIRQADRCHRRRRARRGWRDEGPPRGQQRRQAAPSLRQPPLSLLSDLSYYCVYAVQPACWPAMVSGEVTSAAMHLLLQYVAGLLAIVPDDVTGMCDGQSWSARPGSKANADAIADRAWLIHGHAWADLTAAVSGNKGAASATTAHVVPVTLLALQARSEAVTTTLAYNSARAVTADVCCYLLSPQPVQFCRRALRACAVRLVSHWSPCTAVPQAAALFEWWCAAGPTAVPGVCHRAFQHAVCTVTSQASRVVAPLRRLRGEMHMRIVLLPCLPTHPMTQQAHKSQLAQCAWQMLFLMHAPAETMAPQRTNRLLRRAHFHTARRFYGTLLRYCRGEDVMHTPHDTTVATRPALPLLRVPAGFRAGVRSLAAKERTELLHLLGRPAFPADYGTFTRRSARVDANLAGSDTRVMTRVVRCYGNLTNATRRLIVRAAHAGHALPSAHAVPGAWLLAVRLGDAATGQDGPCAVTRMGVVTSSPFFMQRMGCVVASVWCCFAECAAEDWRALLPDEGQVAAGGPTTMIARRRWCLCPARHAQRLLLRVAAATDRAGATANAKVARPSSRQTYGARQSDQRGGYGRTRDLIEEALCCRDYCTLVTPIELYV